MNADSMRNAIREWVNMETPTGDAARANALGARMAEVLCGFGARVSRTALPGGDLLHAEMGAGPRRALLLGHRDTVFPAGDCEKFDCENGRLYGAGVSDMKAGLVMMAEIFRHFSRALPDGWRLEALINADEETGSRESGPEIAKIARGARACLCFEPSPPGGCALSRKGIARFEIRVKGASAHASAGDPAQKSAIRALSYAIQAAYGLESEEIRVNIGQISGGTRSNIVAGSALARGEMRAFSQSALEEAMQSLREICARAPGGALCEARALSLRPPLAESAESRALYEIARACAAREGLALCAQARGGGSDGALVAACGVPVLDGMGAEGGRAHTRREYVVEETLPARLRTAIFTLETLMSKVAPFCA